MLLKEHFTLYFIFSPLNSDSCFAVKDMSAYFGVRVVGRIICTFLDSGVPYGVVSVALLYLISGWNKADD